MAAASENAVGNHADDEAVGAQADDNARNRRAAAAAYGPFQALIRRINPSLILKLVVLCFLLIQVNVSSFFLPFPPLSLSLFHQHRHDFVCIPRQDGSEVKTALTIFTAVIVYLVSTGVLSPWLSRLQRSIPWHRDQFNREMTVWTVLTEAQVLFVGYFASLFPGWTIPEPQVGRKEKRVGQIVPCILCV